MVVKQVEGAGNSNRLLNYSAIDPSPFSGISYYRLKQTDYDGQYEYSQIRAINFASSTKVIIYPNPANDILNIVGVEMSNTKYIYNSTGKLVKQITNNSNTLNISGLSPGIYYIQIVMIDGNIINQEFVKE